MWRISADTVGVARFHLTKTVGSQQIRLDLDCNPIPSDDDEYLDESKSTDAARGIRNSSMGGTLSSFQSYTDYAR